MHFIELTLINGAITVVNPNLIAYYRDEGDYITIRMVDGKEFSVRETKEEIDKRIKHCYY